MFDLFWIITLIIIILWSRAVNDADSIERVHKKVGKYVLNVQSSTNYFSIYGELGRFPLIIERHKQIVKYSLKLHQTKKDNLYFVLSINRST